MPALDIRFLGECQFIYAGEIVTGLHTKRMRSLLGYLILHAGQQLSATQLAFLYWPNSSEKQARTNLRRLFYNLRKAFPESDQFLNREDYTVMWRLDAPYSLDVVQFELAVDAARKALSVEKGAIARQQLEVAIDLYRGDLLPDCYDDWVLPLREELRQRHLDAIEQLVELLELEGEYKAAIRYAEMALRVDALFEKPYRTLMRLHALNGARARALRVYHACASVLERELGVEPQAETTALYQRLLELDESAQFDDGPKIENMGEDRQLVGRQRERKQLLAAWRKAARGQTSALLISGEAGIGKTRLAEELYRWVSQLGINATRTRAYAASAGLAYAPILDMLRSEPLASRLHALDPIWLTELARLLPDLLRAHPEIAPPQPLAEAWQRARLFEALARAVSMDKQPMLLWVDDLQWCDGESLTWLQYLLQFDPQAPLLILGTVRDEELVGAHPLTQMTHHLRATDRLVEISLERLTPEEAAQLGGQVGGSDLSTQAIEQLNTDAGGNPLFIVEMARAALNAPDFDSSPPVGNGGNNGGAGLSLPPKVYSVIQSRLAQLSPAAFTLAQLAATVGNAFTFDLLAQASGMDEAQLVQSLDELWRRRILRELSTTLTDYAYDFSHDRIRDVAYGELSMVRRRFHHRSVADALEKMHGESLDERSAQIAFHLDHAGDRAGARRHYQAAGVRAASHFAHDEALRYLTRALALTEEEDVETRFDLHGQREHIYQVQTSREAQQRELSAMLQLAEQLDSQRKRSTVLLRQAARAEGLGAYDDAVAFARQAIEQAQASSDQLQQAEGALRLGSVYWNWGDYPRSGAQYQHGLQLARTIGARSLEGAALLHLGALETYYGNYHDAKRISHEALATAGALGDIEGEIWARNQLGFMIVEQGDDDYHEAETHLVAGRDLAREIGSRAYIAKLSSNLAMLYDRWGNFEQALACLDESLAIARDTDAARQRAFALNYRANVLANLGQLSAAQTHYEEALTLFRTIGYRQGEGKTVSELALLALWQNKPKLSLHCADEALTIAQQIDIQRDQAYALTRRGHALAGLGRTDLAVAAYEEALAVYRITAQQTRGLEPAAGLARIAYADGNHERARALLAPVIDRLLTHQADATNEVLWVYHTCCQVLDSDSDPRRPAMIAHARTLLQKRVLASREFSQSLSNETRLGQLWNAFGTPTPLI